MPFFELSLDFSRMFELAAGAIRAEKFCVVIVAFVPTVDFVRLFAELFAAVGEPALFVVFAGSVHVELLAELCLEEGLRFREKLRLLVLHETVLGELLLIVIGIGELGVGLL